MVSRSDDGFLSTVDLREVVIKKKRKRSSDEANMGNVIVTLVSVLIGIIVFYWLIIIPYYVSSNTLPISNTKNLEQNRLNCCYCNKNGPWRRGSDGEHSGAKRAATNTTSLATSSSAVELFLR